MILHVYDNIDISNTRESIWLNKLKILILMRTKNAYLQIVNVNLIIH